MNTTGKKSGNTGPLAAFATAVLCAAFAAPGVQAQQQAAPDPYQGVSQPPASDTIVATPDAPPAVAPAPPAVKPMAATPATRPLPARNLPPQKPAKLTNPDSDMIQSANPPSNDSIDEPAAASFASRGPNPDSDMINAIPSPSNQLAEGTNITVRILDNLSTAQTRKNASFRAQVTRDIYKNGKVIIPSGSELKGRVVQVEQGHRLRNYATLRLRPESIILPDGSAYHLYAQVVASGAEGTRTDYEGGIQPDSHFKKAAIEYGAGAGTGAALGAAAAGPTGALVGTAVGAGLITVHLLKQTPDAVAIPRGSKLIFSLTEPMDLTVTKN